MASDLGDRTAESVRDGERDVAYMRGIVKLVLDDM